jgi:hypothetical protein
MADPVDGIHSNQAQETLISRELHPFFMSDKKFRIFRFSATSKPTLLPAGAYAIAAETRENRSDTTFTRSDVSPIPGSPSGLLIIQAGRPPEWSHPSVLILHATPQRRRAQGLGSKSSRRCAVA